MKILILGGTGAMGIHLVKLLSDDGHSVFVTTRRNRKDEGLIKYITGNAHDNEFLKSLLTRKFDCIVDFMVYSTDEFSKRVRLLLDSCDQYIYLSSSRVYADSETPIT